jgi:hypothetical protein
VRFDRNSAFTLQIHIIEKLRFHIAIANGMRQLQNPISKRRFPVVNMSNN